MENKKITIVIGAGASADFHYPNGGGANSRDIAIPVGEALVKSMINFEEEIPKLLLLKYLGSFSKRVGRTKFIHL